MHGEARLQQLAATVAGVHLESQGGVHATLANGSSISIRSTSRAKIRICGQVACAQRQTATRFRSQRISQP